MPGLPPFVRGPYTTMYVVRPWTVRQYAGFSTAEESNAFYRRNLAAGQKGLSVAFDLPTHRGYDSDHPRVAADVGMAGVAIDSILDMKILFDGISLGDISVSMTMNGAVLPVMALYIVAAEEQGVEAGTARGHDPERHPQGVHGPQHLHLPARAEHADHRRHLRLHLGRHAEVQQHQHQRLPHAGGRRHGRPRARLHDGRRPRVPPHRDRRRADIDDFAPGSPSSGRSARTSSWRSPSSAPRALLWAKIVKEFDPKSPKSMSLRTHSQTSGWSLTAQDVYNNVVRTCIEAMGATQGHTQSLHTNSLDEALALPTDFSARIARNTQLVPPGGDGHDTVVDPWGGSYFVERLTHELARKAWSHMYEIENSAGWRSR